MEPKISLCMIVKNEEDFLDGCLASVEGVVDEIVVLDTGSTDRTPDIARAHGAQVHSHPWKDSYSEARNAAIDRATGDWILVLDADERLDESGKQSLRNAIRDPQADAYSVFQHNYYSADERADVIVNSTCRIWRNQPEHRYAGRVHEDIVHSILARGGRVGQLDVVIHHYGNRPEIVQQRDKCTKYIALLEAELRDDPNNASKLHDIAISYYCSGRFEQALPYVERSLELAKPQSRLAGIAFSTLIGALHQLGRHDEAVAALERAISRGTRHPEMHYTCGQSLMQLGRWQEAADQLKQAIELGKRGSWTGDAAIYGHKAQEAIAMCYLRLEDYAAAAEYGIQALQAKPDRTETREIVANALFHLGDTLSAAGDYSSAADLYTNALTLYPNHAPGFFTLGNCYFRMGAADAAKLAYRKALEIDPNYSDAAHNLEIAEAELAQAAA